MWSSRAMPIVAALAALTLLTGAARVDLLVAARDPQSRDACLALKEVTYAPGQGSTRHAHDATVIAYVLKGAVESQVDDQPLTTYRAGEHWVELPGAQHRVSRNASATEPATFLAVMVGHRGSEEAAACGGQ